MNGLPLVLASRSPRRRELLAQLGIEHEVIPADIDETPRAGEPPGDYVLRIAREKAEAVRASLEPARWVLGADTEVVCDGRIYGKPENAGDAERMLGELAGRAHHVYSAVALAGPGGEVRDALQVSRVRFRPLSGAEVRAYVATGDPLDKAGAYGVQGRAAAFIEHLEGSYSGVMGLPLFETSGLLAAAGLPSGLDP